MHALALRLLVIATVGGLAACGEAREESDAPAGAQNGQPAAGMQDMPNMDGMQGMQGGMMDRMMSHMQMMQGVAGDSMQAMLPIHRQMVANMLAQMNREMREMDMSADAEWNATVDSLRSDLTRLPEMSAAELQAFMPEHHARVMRLSEMHRRMMAEMGPP